MTATSAGCEARVALLGCGAVGGEVARQLLRRGVELGVKLMSVLVRDASRDRGIPRELATGDFRRVLGLRPDVVIEAIGGVDPACAYVSESLRAGVPVVTANKTLVAHRGEELRAIASQRGAALRCEGAVGGAAPVLAALEHLRGDRVRSVRGVVNGTCNYILSRMGEGSPFAGALAEARARGFAEADPSADLSGRDSAEKLCLLADAAGYRLAPGDILVQGIEGVTADDLAVARRARRVLKLVAELEVTDGGVHARVGPALVPEGHPLAALRGEQNGVVIGAELAGEVFVQGRGAGGAATASAILGDLRRILEGSVARPHAPSRPVSAGEASRRQQVVRVHAPAGRLSPDHVMKQLREHGADGAEVFLERGRARATAVLGDAEALAVGLAMAGHSGESLVTPVLA
jgi:homoserine dehydrogenase